MKKSINYMLIALISCVAINASATIIQFSGGNDAVLDAGSEAMVKLKTGDWTNTLNSTSGTSASNWGSTPPSVEIPSMVKMTFNGYYTTNSVVTLGGLGGTRNGGLGVDDFGVDNNDNEDRSIGAGESVVFSFDKEVSLKSLSLNQNGSYLASWGANSVAISTKVTTFDASAANIAANTDITISYVSGTARSISTLVVDVIPEPATLGMIALAGGGLLFIRRRLMF